MSNLKKMKNEVFSQRLKNARLIKGMTQDEVVAGLGETLSKNALSRYERGEMTPRYPILVALARVLDVQLEYFFRPFTVSISQLDFRTKQDLPSMEANRLQLEVGAIMERYLQTEQLLGLKSRFVNPLQALPALKTAEEAEEAAQRLREAWKLGDHGLMNIYGLIESFGIKVIEITAAEAFDGMTCMVNDNIPLIVVNTAMTVERKRFTVLHELAHILLRFDASLDQKMIERICSRFSGAVLMPSGLLKNLIGAMCEQIGLQELILIKNHYGVSLQALMYRAAQLNYISQATNDRFRNFINTNKREEGLGDFHGKETADRFEQLVVRAYHSNRITRSKAAELLQVQERDLPGIFDVIW
jgi:Zn-dependent peptidase ImmA (M78 family)/DNA-binding XRE family transcriptional regulator